MRLAPWLALALLLGCAPRGVLPGTSLPGELVEQAVEDWSFATGHYSLELETLDDSWLPSAESWFFVHNGTLHLHGYSLPGLGIPWVERVRSGTKRVRLRIDGRLYPGELEVLSRRREIEPLLPTALAKYHMVETQRARLAGQSRRYPDTQLDSWWFRFRSEP